MTLFSLTTNTVLSRGARFGITVMGYGLWLSLTSSFIQLTWGKSE